MSTSNSSTSTTPSTRTNHSSSSRVTRSNSNNTTSTNNTNQTSASRTTTTAQQRDQLTTPVARRRTHNFESINNEDPIPTNFNVITIQELVNLKRVQRTTMLFGLLLKIKPAKKAQVNGRMVYSSNQNVFKSNKFNIKGGGTTIPTPYRRMYHFYDISGDNGSIFYILEYNDNNTSYNCNLWDRNVDSRDDGTLSPGCIVCFKTPRTNGNIGEVPVVVINNCATICKYPRQYCPVPIKRDNTNNVPRAFVLNGARLDLFNLFPRKTNCRGLMCDKQNFEQQNCGCIVCTNHKLSHLALTYEMEVLQGDNSLFETAFTSTKFSRIFFDDYFPSNLEWLQLEGKLNSNFERLKDIVEYYNENGGFTVIGWYRKGEIQDDGTTTTSSEINFHVIKIIPTNPEVISPTKIATLPLVS